MFRVPLFCHQDPDSMKFPCRVGIFPATNLMVLFPKYPDTKLSNTCECIILPSRARVNPCIIMFVELLLHLYQCDSLQREFNVGNFCCISCDLTSNVSHNQLKGSLDAALLSDVPTLRTMDLSSNLFTGWIPNLASLINLQHL